MNLVVALERRELLTVAFDPIATYATGGDNLQTVAVGDVNGDGLDDFVAPSAGGNATVLTFLSQGNGTFSAPITSAIGVQPSNLVLADVRPGGPVDLFSSEGYYGVNQSFGDGTGRFIDPQVD